MPLNTTRGISIREVWPGETRVIKVAGIGKGEAIGRYGGPTHIASLPVASAADTVYRFIGPDGFLECNRELIYVPYEVAATFTPRQGLAGDDDSLGSALPQPPTSVAEWDRLATRILLDFGTDGNEYYGANPDDKSYYDANRNIWLRGRGPDSKDAEPSDVDSANPVLDPGRRQDEPLIGHNVLGPVGIQRLASAELFLSPNAVAGPQLPINPTAIGEVITGSLGIVDLNHGATDMLQIDGPINGPGFLLDCITRFDVPQQATYGFSETWHRGGTIEEIKAGITLEDLLSKEFNLTKAQQKEVNRFLNAYFGGDIERVQKWAAVDSSFIGDFARSYLFAGDLHIEQPTIWATNIFRGGIPSWVTGIAQRLRGMAAWFGPTESAPVETPISGTYLRTNGIVVGMKWHLTKLSPYSNRSPF